MTVSRVGFHRPARHSGTSRIWFLIPAIVVALVCPTAAAASCPQEGVDPSVAAPSVMEQATLCLLNAERVARGLHRLSSDERLRALARAHSRDMVARHYFAHRSPAGADYIARLATMCKGRPSWMVGENLAWGENYKAAPRYVVAGWMRSPSHRNNILAPRFARIGLGIVVGVPYRRGVPGATYTSGFATR
jgi:uncharacterized protein YkwD